MLFSDLSGYTAMNERFDPEVVAELVGHVKAEAVGIVEAQRARSAPRDATFSNRPRAEVQPTR